MTVIRFSLCALLTAAVVGCNLDKSRGPVIPATPPTPPTPCNAIWSPQGGVENGDAVVIARSRGAAIYATNSAGKDWVCNWYLVSLDVIAVERGTWKEKDVTFVYPDTWPTRESGIMIDKDMFPFAKDFIFAVTLKTTAVPAIVLALERRSYVAPYGSKKLPSRDADYGKILKPVEDFEISNHVANPKSVASDLEDIGDAWVVHRWGWGIAGGSWLYRVDKKTFVLQPLP
jgi:hypothetical protein